MAAGLRVSLNLESPIPAYRQIADDVRRHLVDERLKPGDLLPPIRQLAVDLGVHFNTVALAYRLLADEGWLELKRRRGATVIARNTPRAVDRRQVDQQAQHPGPLDVAQELVTEALPAVCALDEARHVGHDRGPRIGVAGRIAELEHAEVR